MALTAKRILAAIKADILVEMPSLGGARDNETPFYVTSYAFGGAAVDMHLYKLKAAGIIGRRIYSPYQNLSGIAVPDKYAKKAEKLLFNESTLVEGVGEYSVKLTGSETYEDPEDGPITNKFYDILLRGKVVGELQENGGYGLEGVLYNHPIKLTNYVGGGEGALGKLHRFLKSNTGQAFLAKYATIKEDSQGIEHDAVDEDTTLSVKKCDVCDKPIGAGQSVCADCKKKFNSEETQTTKCKKCGTVSTFGYDGWCKKCWDKNDVNEAFDDVCSCGHPARDHQKSRFNAGAKSDQDVYDRSYCLHGDCECSVFIKEAYTPDSYLSGSDKEGWVVIHKGQPLNANPQGGRPVSRERALQVAKQFKLPDNLPTWDGKGFDRKLQEDRAPKVVVVKAKGRSGYDIELNGEVIEGGFFEKDAAEEAAEFYRTSKDFQVKEAVEPHGSPKGPGSYFSLSKRTCRTCGTDEGEKTYSKFNQTRRGPCPDCGASDPRAVKECSSGKLHEDACRQCGDPMNPVSSLMGPVCGKCARANQAKATGKVVKEAMGDDWTRIAAIFSEEDVDWSLTQFKHVGCKVAKKRGDFKYCVVYFTGGTTDKYNVEFWDNGRVIKKKQGVDELQLVDTVEGFI
jgi:hypothetical protein